MKETWKPLEIKAYDLTEIIDKIVANARSGCLSCNGCGCGCGGNDVCHCNCFVY